MDKYQKLFIKLGIKPINPELIKQTFIHRSFLNEAKKPISDNERLEFLGDSILSFSVSEHLYQNYPQLPEGELTNLRSSIVKTATLADVARLLDLGTYLFLSKGEEESGGRGNPSLLADTFEALIGSVYLTQGIKSIKIILQKLLFPRLSKIIKDRAYKDAKSSFQEMVQEKHRLSPLYKVMSETGPDHAKLFKVAVYVGEKVYGTGVGKSKQEAEQIAATAALEKWKEI